MEIISGPVTAKQSDTTADAVPQTKQNEQPTPPMQDVPPDVVAKLTPEKLADKMKPENVAFANGVKEAIDEVQKKVDETVRKEERKEVADVASNTSSDPLLSAAADGHKRFDQDDRIADPGQKVEITKRHRDAFVDSVVTGDRYRESFSLLGGGLKLVIRSRTNEETEAISAYARRMVSTGVVKVDYDYSALMRKLLAIAQVEEINGVKNPEMLKPLFFVEDENGISPPAWAGMVDVWSAKPESLLTMVTRCILEFEGRYWHMINHVSDVNFWRPGESTGE